MATDGKEPGRSPRQRRTVRRFVLQWHVTERCNLRCAHCYQEDYRGLELSYAELLGVVDQFRVLLEQLRARDPSHDVHGHINVSGGEPFVRSDFLQLLDVFREHRESFTFAILTNGTLIDSSLARRLRELSPESVQVSIEGTRETNDEVRGDGLFARTVAALENLARERVPAVISFTAHRQNYREFGEVARLGRKLRVKRVWADRLIPWGSAVNAGCSVLSPGETHEFFECMYAARAEGARSFCRTEIAMGRALQFLVGGDVPYRCAAGEDLVTLQANGDVLPCRRLPIAVGNVRQKTLSDIYWEDELFKKLRAHRVSEGCEECTYAERCRGGLRCLAHAMTGDPFKADPGCWRAVRESRSCGAGVATCSESAEEDAHGE